MIDIAILGSGPAGFSAAIYAARSGYKTTVIAGDSPGGQLMITTDVENYPGAYPIMGPALMDIMEQQAKKCNAEIIPDHIIGVDFKKQPFKLVSRSKGYLARSVIIATGARFL